TPNSCAVPGPAASPATANSSSRPDARTALIERCLLADLLRCFGGPALHAERSALAEAALDGLRLVLAHGDDQLVVGIEEGGTDELALVGVDVRAARERAAAPPAGASEADARVLGVALGRSEPDGRPDVDEGQHGSDLARLHVQVADERAGAAEHVAEPTHPRALVVLVRHHDLGFEQIVGDDLLTLAARSALARLVAAGTPRFIAEIALTGSAFDDDEAVGLQDHHVEQRSGRSQPRSVVAIPGRARVFLDAQDTERLVAVLQRVAGSSARIARLAEGGRGAGQASCESHDSRDRTSAAEARCDPSPVCRGYVLHVRSPSYVDHSTNEPPGVLARAGSSA